jgi:hypothetical protein
MNRIFSIIVLFAALTAGSSLAAEPAQSSQSEIAAIATLENELYAQARVTRDLMAALQDSGRLGTAEGQAEMEALRGALAVVQDQVSTLRGERKELMAARRTEKARSARSVIALRDRGQAPREAPRNARR